MKCPNVIQDIIRTIITGKVGGAKIVPQVRKRIEALNLPQEDATRLFQAIETEIASLHDGNIARFKVRPSEFQGWKALK